MSLSNDAKKSLVRLYRLCFKNSISSNEYSALPCFNFNFIRGSRILFVSQNPGNPFTLQEINRFEKMSMLNFRDYQKEFNESWSNSLFGKFYQKVCSYVSKDCLEESSFTNLIKRPTIKNKTPILSNLDLDCFKKELEIISPKLIVFLSKFAHDNSGDLINRPVLVFKHPATMKYADNYAKEIANKICLI